MLVVLQRKKNDMCLHFSQLSHYMPSRGAKCVFVCVCVCVCSSNVYADRKKGESLLSLTLPYFFCCTVKCEKKL